MSTDSLPTRKGCFHAWQGGNGLHACWEAAHDRAPPCLFLRGTHHLVVHILVTWSQDSLDDQARAISGPARDGHSPQPAPSLLSSLLNGVQDRNRLVRSSVLRLSPESWWSWDCGIVSLEPFLGSGRMFPVPEATLIVSIGCLAQSKSRYSMVLNKCPVSDQNQAMYPLSAQTHSALPWTSVSP